VHEKNEIAIKDACILIDLIDLALLKEFFQLDLIVFTTPQVINEITDENQKLEVNQFLDKGVLNIDAEGVFEKIQDLVEEFSTLSFADCSVIEVAERRNAIIFSADGSLRKISKKQGFTVRGTLWIIKEFYEKNILTGEEAIRKLELYSEINERAPRKEINKLIEELNKKPRK